MISTPGLSARLTLPLTVKSTINRLRATFDEPPVIVTVLRGGYRI